MSKWKCEICGNEFENFHAQDFDRKIYCPLCYFKKENKILKENAEHNDKVVDKVNWENMLLKKENEQLKDNWNMLKEHLTNRYNNGTESISYRQVFIEIRKAMQVLEIQQELEQRRQELEQGSDK